MALLTALMFYDHHKHPAQVQALHQPPSIASARLIADRQLQSPLDASRFEPTRIVQAKKPDQQTYLANASTSQARSAVDAQTALVLMASLRRNPAEPDLDSEFTPNVSNPRVSARDANNLQLFQDEQDSLVDLDSTQVAESNQIEHSSDCALILKRTYILKAPVQDEWGEKFVFNDVDTDVAKK